MNRIIGENPFTYAFEGVSFSDEQDELRNEINQGILFEKDGWRVEGPYNDFCYLTSPCGINFSQNDLTSPRGLKFGNYESITRLEGARYYYLFKKYQEYLLY